MKYRRKDMLGQEEELEGSVVEIMLLLQFVDNKEKFYVWMEDGELLYDDEKLMRERGKLKD